MKKEKKTIPPLGGGARGLKGLFRQNIMGEINTVRGKWKLRGLSAVS